MYFFYIIYIWSDLYPVLQNYWIKWGYIGGFDCFVLIGFFFVYSFDIIFFPVLPLRKIYTNKVLIFKKSFSQIFTNNLKLENLEFC